MSEKYDNNRSNRRHYGDDILERLDFKYGKELVDYFSSEAELVDATSSVIHEDGMPSQELQGRAFEVAEHATENFVNLIQAETSVDAKSELAAELVVELDEKFQTVAHEIIPGITLNSHDAAEHAMVVKQALREADRQDSDGQTIIETYYAENYKNILQFLVDAKVAARDGYLAGLRGKTHSDAMRILRNFYPPEQ